MFRRILTLVVCLAAIASVVVAIGVRVQAARAADPAQILRRYLPDVPADIGRFARVVGNDVGGIQIELRADVKWVRIFATRNGLMPVEGTLSGMSAERWTLVPDRSEQPMVHLLMPLDGGGPALLTVVK